MSWLVIDGPIKGSGHTSIVKGNPDVTEWVEIDRMIRDGSFSGRLYVKKKTLSDPNSPARPAEYLILSDAPILIDTIPQTKQQLESAGWSTCKISDYIGPQSTHPEGGSQAAEDRSKIHAPPQSKYRVSVMKLMIITLLVLLIGFSFFLTLSEGEMPDGQWPTDTARAPAGGQGRETMGSPENTSGQIETPREDPYNLDLLANALNLKPSNNPELAVQITDRLREIMPRPAISEEVFGEHLEESVNLQKVYLLYLATLPSSTWQPKSWVTSDLTSELVYQGILEYHNEIRWRYSSLLGKFTDGNLQLDTPRMLDSLKDLQHYGVIKAIKDSSMDRFMKTYQSFETNTTFLNQFRRWSVEELRDPALTDDLKEERLLLYLKIEERNALINNFHDKL